MKQTSELKVWCFASMDGLVARSDGDIDFILDFPGLNAFDYGFREFYDSIGCGIMNHSQYNNLQSWEAYPLAGKPCHIVTQECFFTPPGKDIRLLTVPAGEEDAFVREIRQLQCRQTGAIWLIGDNELLSIAFQWEIIAELTINYIPKTIGTGIPLFSPIYSETKWKPVHHHLYGNGVLQVQYRRME